MLQKYTFFDGGTIEFDDSKTVRELIAYAFEELDYYEPLGMDIVTVFQAHHSKTNTGWFTTNVELSCAEEIENREELFFAYYLPGVFYFAEGGWGHHMCELGNHPEIPEAVSVRIRCEYFDNTIVINGRYCFNDIVKTLKKSDYIYPETDSMMVRHVGCIGKDYPILFSDPIMTNRLSELYKTIDLYNSERFKLQQGEFIYQNFFEIN